ncbi:MAG: hypothetical protein IBX50_04160 [Marinospirillum sp.]|uniref:hypothetical protein n=1 Tax=Marinospirillum sp. TaxID=2183934 RepID=UPI0019DE2DF1|nr:hypothetical protein [Marinospirillum sp.]MBE0505900.1 hypothetical protein [Marinospirillum sp.]
MLINDVSWREEYSSAALNRKFGGAIKPGIYGGFSVAASIDQVTVSHADSAAVADIYNPVSAEIDGIGKYLLTIHMTADVVIPCPVGSHYLVIRASYGIKEQTASELLFVSAPQERDLIICEATLVAAGQPPQLDFSSRSTMSVASDAFVVEMVNQLADRNKDTTGFPNRTASRLLFDDVTRTVTIQPTNGISFDVFYRNRKITLPELSIQVADVSGGRYINIDPVTEQLVEGGEFPSIENDLLAAYVYYNAGQGKFVIKGDERHSSSRDTGFHQYAHRENGMTWRDGGGITYVSGDDSQLSVGISTPLIVADEDLQHAILHSAIPVNPFEQVLDVAAEIPVIYVDSDGFYRQDDAATLPYKAGVSGIAYNPISEGLGDQLDVPSGKYVNYYIIATNCTKHPVKTIQGRAVFDSVDDALGEVVDFYGLQLAEVKPLYQVTLQSDVTYLAPMKSSIEHVGIPGTAKVAGSPVISATDHASLSGRTKPDQHPMSAITGLQGFYDSVIGAMALAGTLTKSNRFMPAFTTVSGLQASQGFSVSVGGDPVFFAQGTPVTLPALTDGADYKIYAKDDGSLEAAIWDAAEPLQSRLIGGFHVYHVTGTINPSSIWDLCWLPKNGNPRGRTLAPDKREWVDIYLMDVDYGINCYSRPNAQIADGSSLPKIPAIYGGNGDATYPNMTWYVTWDLAIAAGCRLPFYGEFTGFAYGVVERQSVGVDPVTTRHQAGHRSACGVEQATGCMWQWGADINGTSATGSPSWQDITGGRGDVYTHSIRAVLLGARWGSGLNSGSRASHWNASPDISNDFIGARGVCDHLIL